jgi:hypothetical protein
VAQTIRGIFTSLKPENLKAINDLEEKFATQFQGESDKKDLERSIALGKSVGDGILAWAGTDGFAEFNDCPYVPADVPGAWEPTPPAFKPPLQPCWGQLRCWVLDSSADCPALGHPDFSTDSTSQFYANALEDYNINLHLTDEQKTIALFWGDSPVATGTPPGHWIAIVGQIARNDGLSLADAAEAYVRAGIAVHDAFIQCWYVKYVTNLQRPVTFIDDNIAGGWLPFLTTPNFPTYTSGHSTQSGAVAEVLTDMFGLKPFTDTIRTDHNLGDPRVRGVTHPSTRRRTRRRCRACTQASTSASTTTMVSSAGAASDGPSWGRWTSRSAAKATTTTEHRSTRRSGLLPERRATLSVSRRGLRVSRFPLSPGERWRRYTTGLEERR